MAALTPLWDSAPAASNWMIGRRRPERKTGPGRITAPLTWRRVLYVCSTPASAPISHLWVGRRSERGSFHGGEPIMQTDSYVSPMKPGHKIQVRQIHDRLPADRRKWRSGFVLGGAYGSTACGRTVDPVVTAAWYCRCLRATVALCHSSSQATFRAAFDNGAKRRMMLGIGTNRRQKSFPGLQSYVPLPVSRLSHRIGAALILD
jgi:hypothetical protein